MIQKGLHEVLAAVLVIKIVSMFPHVAGQERGLPMCQRRVRVRGLDDLQPVAILDQPDPTAAELSDGRGNEGILELLETAEGLFDQFQQAPRRLSATAWFHTLPEKRV